ncbi:molybdate ABC transporter substrate-binding protein [Aeromicrobium choanae]|uniref:Molybdate transport system substrate-binding protein n=1 Tax=Aeromicrobium choanae TaxID=1736691 RepID=A0A1T4Z3Z8_9ACTN|nr:molybdate ABC transporter substrate-binding protein [Aeromicrobium choanae]SKB08666.1 molybdate transport system substrate-binding protein [Aeromicrobium choanae]
MRRAGVAALALVALLTVAGCGGSDGDQVEQRTLTVFAAASLTSTFTELAERFEAEHEGVEVRLSFGGSSDLAAQIAEGAPADVFAAADEQTMARVTGASDAALAPEVFATNTLQIATPADAPDRVRDLADLADPALKVVLCAPQVPCGAATRTLLAKNALDVEPVSEEQSVTDVLGKVTSGEADAGVVYRTDVIGAGDTVRGVDAARAGEVVNRYPVVALDDGEPAGAFVRFVTSGAGREILVAAGFGTP